MSCAVVMARTRSGHVTFYIYRLLLNSLTATDEAMTRQAVSI